MILFKKRQALNLNTEDAEAIGEVLLLLIDSFNQLQLMEEDFISMIGAEKLLATCIDGLGKLNAVAIRVVEAKRRVDVLDGLVDHIESWRGMLNTLHSLENPRRLRSLRECVEKLGTVDAVLFERRVVAAQTIFALFAKKFMKLGSKQFGLSREEFMRQGWAPILGTRQAQDTIRLARLLG